jgi:hypothetical protein
MMSVAIGVTLGLVIPQGLLEMKAPGLVSSAFYVLEIMKIARTGSFVMLYRFRQMIDLYLTHQRTCL